METGCETWSPLADFRKKESGFDTKSLRKLLRISYLDHKTNDRVRSKINFHVGPQESLLVTVEETETRMVRACRAPRQSLQNHPSGHLGGWVTPWPSEKCWMNVVKEWTSLPMPELRTMASSR